MALFEVKGWDLKPQVAVSTAEDKKKQKKKEKNDKRKQELAKRKHAELSKSQEQESTQPKHPESEAKESKEQKPKDKTNVKSSKKRKHDAVDKLEQPDTPAQSSSMETTKTKLTPLQQKMLNKLSGSRFRWINEQLYTISSQEALDLIKTQPELFDEYHQGFRSQVQSWPQNPVDVFVDQFKTRISTKQVNAPGGLPGLPSKKVVIADMGCGEAEFALQVGKYVEQYNNKKKKVKRNGGAKHLDVEVHSFDLKKHNERITVADVANVPIGDESCSVVIFCLALMGTNFLDFIEEAYRILAPRGELWIAEIKSRFNESSDKKSVKDNSVGEEFVETLKLLGFFHKTTDNSNSHFTRFEFFKPQKEILQERIAKLQRKKKFVEQESEKEELDEKRSKRAEGEWLLKPCIYKRR
jgi:ribosomal RNA-processing protein 8